MRNYPKQIASNKIVTVVLAKAWHYWPRKLDTESTPALTRAHLQTDYAPCSVKVIQQGDISKGWCLGSELPSATNDIGLLASADQQVAALSRCEAFPGSVRP